MDWQRARTELAALRERAYRRAITSALRQEETWKLADHYAPPTARMLAIDLETIRELARGY